MPNLLHATAPRFPRAAASRLHGQGGFPLPIGRACLARYRISTRHSLSQNAMAYFLHATAPCFPRATASRLGIPCPRTRCQISFTRQLRVSLALPRLDSTVKVVSLFRSVALASRATASRPDIPCPRTRWRICESPSRDSGEGWPYNPSRQSAEAPPRTPRPAFPHP